MYTANAIVQLLIYFLIAFAVSEFRMRILLLPFKSPLIVLILILSLIGASALTSVSTHVEFEEISKLSKSMNAVASGDFGFQLETRSGIDEIKDAYRSFNIMVEELDMINTLQRDFVSNVSHEFKTPINVIEGYLTLLRTPGLSEEERTFDVVVFTSEGLYGQPLSIASSYVAAFVLFGSFLSITGAGQWFIDMAFSLTGKYRSSPP